RQRPPHPAGQARPAAGGTGVRVRHRGTGGARPSARPQPALLRLQGRQRHPDRGRAEADRHGRGAPHGRRRVGHLRHGRLPGPRSGRGGPVRGVRPVHGRADAGRAHLRLPGLHHRLRRLPARPGHHRRLPAVRVVLPLPGARHRPRPGPQVRLRAGDGRAADGRPARGGVAPDGPGPSGAVHPVRPRTAGHRHRVVPRARRGRVPPGRPRTRPGQTSGRAAPPPPPPRTARRRAPSRPAPPHRRRRTGPAGPELRVTDTELFPALDGDVSRLGGRAPGRGRRPGGQPPAPPAPELPAAAPALVRPVDTAAAGLALPVPLVDSGDPNAGFLAGLQTSAPGDLLHALAAAPAPSTETRLREIRARLETGEAEAALRALRALEERHPDDWRVVWYRGVAALATGDHEGAALAFDAIYDAFPGEIAPKLALGLCAEVLGQLDNAAEYYRLVWSTDPSHVSAAFGLARVRFAAGDRRGAVGTLESVPESSIHYTAARVAAVRARLRGRTATAGDVPFLDDLSAAAGQVEALEAYGL